MRRSFTLLLMGLGLVALLSGCSSESDQPSGPPPKFGAAAGPPGTAAGAGGDSPTQPNVKGDSSEAK